MDFKDNKEPLINTEFVKVLEELKCYYRLLITCKYCDQLFWEFLFDEDLCIPTIFKKRFKYCGVFQKPKRVKDAFEYSILNGALLLKEEIETNRLKQTDQELENYHNYLISRSKEVTSVILLDLNNESKKGTVSEFGYQKAISSIFSNIIIEDAYETEVYDNIHIEYHDFTYENVVIRPSVILLELQRLSRAISEVISSSTDKVDDFNWATKGKPLYAKIFETYWSVDNNNIALAVRKAKREHPQIPYTQENLEKNLRNNRDLAAKT